MDNDRDLLVFTNDEGETIELEILDYFEYGGKEYAMLIEADAHGHHCDADCCCDAEDHEDIDVYLMEVQEDEEGQRFVPVDDDMMEELIEAINDLYREDDSEDDSPIENDEL